MEEKQRIWVISICAVAAFILVLIYGFTMAPHGLNPDNRESLPPIPTYILSLAFLFIIIAIIPIFYFLLQRGLKKNFHEAMDIILQSLKENSNEKKPLDSIKYEIILLNTLNYQERQIIKKLTEKKGMVLQSEISRMNNIGKVKAHRTIKDLERKGIIKMERYGNTNRILLKEDIKKIFKN